MDICQPQMGLCSDDARGKETASGGEDCMNRHVYETLRKVARAGGVITYAEIAPLAGVDLNTGSGRREMGRILAEICQNEVGQGRPMLGSVVVRKDTGWPGRGYLRGAERLGKFRGGVDEDGQAFWLQELNKVHAYWSSH